MGRGFFIQFFMKKESKNDSIWRISCPRSDRPGNRWKRDQRTRKQRKSRFLHWLRPDRRQPACRTLYGTLPDETSPDGRQQADRFDRWRYRNDRWSVRTYRHAPDDDQRDDRPQRRMLQKADEPFHRFFRWQSAFSKQCGLALRSELCRCTARYRTAFLRKPHAHRRVLQTAYGTRSELPGI